MTKWFSTIETVHRALDYHARRHNLLASNLANTDTPGFRPLELLRAEQASLSTDLSLERTRSDHLSGIEGFESETGVVLEDATAPVGADGNAVSLDREMAKLSANDIRYSAASGIVKRKLAMARYLANDGHGA